MRPSMIFAEVSEEDIDRAIVSNDAAQIDAMLSTEGVVIQWQLRRGHLLAKAIANNTVNSARRLVELGSPLTVAYEAERAPLGWDALMQGIQLGHVEIAGELLKLGADVNEFMVCERPIRPLHYVVAFMVDRDRSVAMSLVRLLCQNGARVNALSRHGVSALHEAAFAGYTDIALELMRLGGNPQRKSKRGQSAFDAAFEMNKVETLEAMKAFLASKKAQQEIKRVNTKKAMELKPL